MIDPTTGEEQINPLESMIESTILQNEEMKEQGSETNALLEAIALQTQENNPEPILGAIIVNDNQNTEKLVGAIKELKPELEKSASSTDRMVNFLEQMKGEKGDKGETGDKGDKGDQGEQGIQGVQGEKGEKGDTGEKGEKGDTGKEGKKGRDGLDGSDGKDGKDGKKGKDGSPDTGEEIVTKLSKLKGEKRLDKSAIKGLDKMQKEIDHVSSFGSSGQEYRIAGTKVSANSQTLNFIAGSNTTITGAATSDGANITITATGGGGGAVDSVNGQTGVVVLDTDDIADTATNRYTDDTAIARLANTSGTNTGDQDLSSYATTSAVAAGYQPLASVLTNTTASFTTADETKLDNITVTQAVDLDAMEADINALANGMVYKGNWDASAGTFPGGGTAQTGWFYTVSVGGTVDSVVFNIDDRLVATTDNASTTTYAGNWTKLDATDAVTSVFSRTGNVVATSGDYNTSQVTENTNLYFTDERAQDAVGNAVGAGLSYDDGTGAISSTITQYTDELAQDAVGGILTDSAEIDFTYNDGVPSITASIVSGSIDETKLDASVNASLDLADTAVQPAGLSNYFNKTTDDTDDITDTATNRFTTDTDITRLANTSGTNTGDQTSVSGNAGTATALQNARTIGTLTGDVTTAGSSFDGTANNTNATTLATVNSNVGSFGSATAAGTFTVNAKGLVTAAGSTTITPAVGSITGLGTGVGTALAINVGSAGAPVLFNGAGGTPSSMTATNLTGTASGLTAGNVTTNANLTGVVTSVGNATSIADAALSIAKTSGLQTALDGKQATLVSATNIKTINSNSLLGAGDLVIPALTDGDKGDITVSSSGATWTIDNDVVTYAKIQNVSATDRLLGRDTAGAGDIEELTVSGGLEFTGTGIQRSALTGEVTASAGSNTIILDKTAISSKLSVNPALDDYVLIGDTNNGDNLKKTTISNIGNLFGQIPIGGVIDWAASTLPTGYLYCDGSEISRTTYADLFTVIGTTFGAGDGSTTYALPDARGRTIAGMDNMNNVAGTGGGDAGRLTSASKAGIDGDTLGASGGEEQITLTHQESGVPAHAHAYVDRYRGTVTRQNGGSTTGSATLTSGGYSTSDNTPQNASEAHNNVQPTLVLNKIIRFGI